MFLILILAEIEANEGVEGLERKAAPFPTHTSFSVERILGMFLQKL